MYSRDSELDADTYRAFEEERILEADEIAAELEPDGWPEPMATELQGYVQRIPSLQPSAAEPSADHEQLALQDVRAELTRLRSRMRARDAYLVELEQALDQSTRQLTAAGLASVDDIHRLLGRVRGQAFRIAELESELRTAHQALASVQRKPRVTKPAASKPVHAAPRPAAAVTDDRYTDRAT